MNTAESTDSSRSEDSNFSRDELVEVAILIVAFNAQGDLASCLESVIASGDAGVLKRIVVVDNASGDETTQVVKTRFPVAHLVRSEVNLGFSGGNNLAWESARQLWPNVRYLALLNQDTVVRSGWLAELVNFLEQHPKAGATQSTLLLDPERDLVNTIGNRCHYLGFGLLSGYRMPASSVTSSPAEIDAASGAAMLVRRDLIEGVGLFDDEMFLYLEDVELAWKLRQVGYSLHLVPQSVVWHKYTALAPYKNYFYLERNRWLLLLTYYRLPTLILIAPAALFMEFGQLLFAWKHGLWKQHYRAWGYFFRPRNLSRLLRQRGIAQRRRTISDRQFTSGFQGSLRLESIKTPLPLRLANPILAAWWRVVRWVIFW